MTSDAPRAGIFFWFVAIIALFWNSSGAMNFFMQMSAENLDNFPSKYQELISLRPTWATIAFGFGAITSVFGAIALLMRRAWAFALFVISFLAVLITLAYSAPLQVASGLFSIGELVMTILLPIAFSTYLVIFSKRYVEAGVLK